MLNLLPSGIHPHHLRRYQRNLNLKIRFKDAKKNQTEFNAFLGAILSGLRRAHKGAWRNTVRGTSRENHYYGKFQVMVVLCDQSGIPVVRGLPISGGFVKVRRLPNE